MTDPSDRHRRRPRARRRATTCAVTRRRRRRRRIGGAAALAVARSRAARSPPACSSSEDVARSMPAGTKFLVGTDADVHVVKEGVEYHCTIKGHFKSEIDDLRARSSRPWTRPSTSTAAAARCTATAASGAATSARRPSRQQIIGPGFLGEYAPSPGVG